MTTKYCIGSDNTENQHKVNSQILKNEKAPRGTRRFSGQGANREGRRQGRAPPPPYFPPFFDRLAALARMRWIWPRGSVTKISPIHSGFTPLIALALKLTRLTTEGDFPFSMVFR